MRHVMQVGGLAGGRLNLHMAGKKEEESRVIDGLGDKLPAQQAPQGTRGGHRVCACGVSVWLPACRLTPDTAQSRPSRRSHGRTPPWLVSGLRSRRMRWLPPPRPRPRSRPPRSPACDGALRTPAREKSCRGSSDLALIALAQAPLIIAFVLPPRQGLVTSTALPCLDPELRNTACELSARCWGELSCLLVAG